jgi:uncharacterized membrane protein
MFGLTALGILHTLISLVAVGAGLVALCRDGAIAGRGSLVQVYVIATVLTCLTALGIFRHGGFNIAHALALLTLAVLAVAVTAGRTTLFGRASRHVETIAYSMSFLFHLIPAITEVSTRLPPQAPLASGPDDPALKAATGVLLLLFLVGASIQVVRLRR